LLTASIAVSASNAPGQEQMKRYGRNLVVWLSVAVSFATSAPGTIQQGFDQALAQRYPLESELAAATGPNAWLLEPSTFEQLSAGGRRAALILNGLLVAREQPKDLIQQAVTISPNAAPGENVRVNNPAMDTFGHTQSETSIAVNGSNIAISFNDADLSNSSGYVFSTDGGNTFTHKRIPLPPGGNNLGDGVLAFGPSGELYHCGIAFFRTSDGAIRPSIGLSKSTDGGASFTTPVDASTTASNANDFQDKPWMTADRNASSPNKGNVYVTWTDFTTSEGSFILLARSTNGGNSFEPPINLSPKDRTQLVQGSMPAVAPNGDLYVAYFDLHFSSAGGITIVKSTDGGKSFSTPTLAARFTRLAGMTGGNGLRTNSFPWITVDNNNVVHIVFAAITRIPGVDPGDIYYVRSTDGGNTFSQPLKLNDDATTNSQLLPSIAVAGDGRLGVKWWDRRNDPLNDSLTDVYMTISTDGGASFGKNFRITDHNWVFGPVEPGFAAGYHGDYDGIAADGNSFFLSWSDERGNDPDVYFTRIPTIRDPNTPDFNLSTIKPYDNVIAGGSADFDLTTSSVNGFTGNLALSVESQIDGLNYSFVNPLTVAGQQSRITVSTSPNTQPGTYLITVSAQDTSGAKRKTSFRLRVYPTTRPASAPVNATRTRGFTRMRSGMKVDAAGIVHLAFDDESGNLTLSEVFYTQSVDGGRTFSTPIKVSANQTQALQSTMALDSSGNIYVVWTGRANPTDSLATFLSRSTDRGSTFSPPVKASGTARLPQLPNIAIDKSGNILITFLDTGQANFPLFAVRSTDGGASFSAPAQISQANETLNISPNRGGLVAFDSGGAAYVLYNSAPVGVSGATAQIMLAVAAAGQSFATPKLISNKDVSAFSPQLAVDKNNNLLLSFYYRMSSASQPNNREITFVRSSDKGNTFSLPLNLSNNLGQSTNPFLIPDSSGNLNIVWEDTTGNSNGDIFFSRSTDGGATFGPPVNVSENIGVSSSSTVSFDSSGNLFIAWVDDSGANPDVFVASLNPSNLNAADFALNVVPAVVSIERGTRATFAININRQGSFSSNLVFLVPDLSVIKAKGVSLDSAPGGVSLSFKLKGNGPIGLQLFTIEGRDDSGRTRLGIFQMVIQPTPSFVLGANARLR
jgi:hypothetical protein